MAERNVIYRIKPGKLTGSLEAQPSKSVSHRAVICAALAGSSSVTPLSVSEDIKTTSAAINDLLEGKTQIHCAESGSTLRFLFPLALVLNKKANFTGEGRLMSRPMECYQEICQKQGIFFEHNGESISVAGDISPGDFSLRGDISSQFITGLLFALPLLNGDSRIILTTPLESKKYVDITEQVLEKFSITFQWETENSIFIPGGQEYKPYDYIVEGDWSHAAFHLAAGALGGPVSVSGIERLSTQGDRAIYDLLRAIGSAGGQLDNETWTITGDRVKETMVIDGSQIPDLIPILAVTACGYNKMVRLENIARLRLKESDRLTAISNELASLGANLREGEDWLEIYGRGSLSGGRVNSHNDHRIAMSLAIASCICEEAVELENPLCTAKSAPGFWDEFIQIGGEFNELG